MTTWLDPSGTFVHVAVADHDPAAMLRLCAARFVAGGFGLTGHGPGWLSATRGPVLDGHAQFQALSVHVESDGRTVRFSIRGLGRGFFPDSPVIGFLRAQVGSILAAYDSWVVQSTMSGPDPVWTMPTRHVVERQTVVARCRYCRVLTQVDAATCQHCGAAGFT